MWSSEAGASSALTAAQSERFPSRVDVALRRRRRNGLQSVARLTGAAVSNGIRHDDEVLADMEWLAFGEQEIGSTRLQELPASASRPMQQGMTLIGVSPYCFFWLIRICA